MITLDDKLDMFYKVVFKTEEIEAKNKLELIENENKSIIEEKKIEMEEKKKEIINRREILGKSEKNEMISKATQESREKILQKRELILEDLILSLEERARKFTEKNEYKDYLINNISNVIKNMDLESITISLLEEDKKRFGNLILKSLKDKNKDIKIQITKEDIIGGFIIKSKDYNLDNSFKTIIEENRYNIGKGLYLSLKKTGEVDE